jgi:uncharacterized OB-fold protein
MMMRYASDGRPLPTPTDTSLPFFEGAREGRLVLQRCPRDGFFFYPRSRCPSCLADDWQWETVSGRGSIHAFTVDRIGHDPALASQVPFVIAIIELDEGPRMTANIVDCEVDAVRVGMPVEASFENIDDVTLVRFRPVAA